MATLKELRTEIAEAFNAAGFNVTFAVSGTIDPPVVAVTRGLSFIARGDTFGKKLISYDVTFLIGPESSPAVDEALDALLPEIITVLEDSLSDWDYEDIQPYSFSIEGQEAVLGVRVTLSIEIELGGS
ncbi:hypothetical protein PV735_38795 [Streptomyces turgidiscabies]|uniref:hypothetical protein n=1 Tax=Streptomyces TaxID=1883 RepID=UPI00117C28C3|nr:MULTISPECIES: hypothetical protein [Streptomyces]MDX3498598.1 hypothetical protein [Streptomyces turgidiscabies]